MWLLFLFGLFLIFMGLTVHVFKWHFLIAGYNTMPKEKKAKVDVEGVARLMGFYGYINGAVFILVGVLQAFDIEIGVIPPFVFFGLSTVYLLIRVQRYDGNLYDKSGKFRKEAGKQVAAPVTITIASLILVALLMFFSSQETKVTFLEEGLRIHGMYGEVYAWESIEEVRLIESLPRIELRTNGAAVGPHLKGHFRTTEHGAVKLFVNKKEPPFIFMRNNGRIVIFNFGEAGKTVETYEEIRKRTE